MSQPSDRTDFLSRAQIKLLSARCLLVLVAVCVPIFSGCSVSGKSTSHRREPGIYYGNQVFGRGLPGRLLWPLELADLTSPFGPRNRRGVGEFHDGIDLAAPVGTSVYAAHSGQVVYSGDDLGSFGKLVIIRGDDQLFTLYAHNSRIHVEEGERVRRGQEIAAVGNTGHTTGPHLHFEVRMFLRGTNLAAVDPLPILERNRGKPRYRINDRLAPLLAKLSN